MRKIHNDGKIHIGKDYNIKAAPGFDLKEELYGTYLEILRDGKSERNSFLSKLLNKDFQALQTKDTESALRVIREVGRIATETGCYFDKKKQNDADYSKFMLYDGLMQWQRNVFNSLSKRKALLAGRRAGKSYEIVSELLKHCLKGVDEYNGVKKTRQALYIGLTIEKAANTIWQLLKDTIEKCHIPVMNIDNSKYSITLANGAIIDLGGNSNKAEREKYRGRDYSMVIIDEMQSQVGVLYLVNSIFAPIIKGRNGDLILSGTGPLSAGTFWEDVCTGQKGEWEVFHATMEDNTTIPNHEEALAQVLKENGWTKDNITFRREYLGEIAYDTNILLYPFREYYDDLKDLKFKECYIGLDFGYVDATALAPILITEDNRMFLAHEFKQSGLSATDIINEVKAKVDFISKTYGISSENIRVICDNNEQNISRDIYNAGVYNIECAYKQNQKYQLRLVRDSLDSGNLKIQKGSYFDQECNSLVWKWNQEKGCVIYEIDDETYHGDICDAVQYAIAKHYSDCVGVEEIGGN